MTHSGRRPFLFSYGFTRGSCYISVLHKLNFYDSQRLFRFPWRACRISFKQQELPLDIFCANEDCPPNVTVCNSFSEEFAFLHSINKIGTAREIIDGLI